MDFERGELALRGGEPYTVEGDEALKIWVRLALDAGCRRWEYSAHSGDYGNELAALLGRSGDAGIRESLLRRAITETLLVCPYITGAGSTIEGSLAGDILRACADGCAELWSTEIDGLEERAFVASAAGEWLTRVCADRGISRREGEEDEALRARALEGLRRQGASGNADDYAEWCGAVADILRVRVLPLARGAGTVDVVAVGRDGRAATAAAVAAAQEIVDEKRPVGADAKVTAAVEKPLNIAASVVLSEGASLEGVTNAFEGAFTAFCRDGALSLPAWSATRV